MSRIAHKKKYVFTPARRAALRKAIEASAKSRKVSAGTRHAKSIGNAAIKGGLAGGIPGAGAAAGAKATGIAVSSVKKKARKVTKQALPKSVTGKPKVVRGPGRGSGLSGLKRNAIPYARVNARSSTIGINAGTVIPGTGKRIVLGGYGKIESTRKHTAIDKAVAGRKAKVLRPGSPQHKVVSYLRKQGHLKNPALRANVAGSQVRLGTSRHAGPTVIIRRGSHSTSKAKSRSGVQKYDKRMSTIAGHKAKKPRPQRRNAAKKRK